MTIPNTIIRNTGAMIANSTAIAPSRAIRNLPNRDRAKTNFPQTDFPKAVFFNMALTRFDAGIYAYNF